MWSPDPVADPVFLFNIRLSFKGHMQKELILKVTKERRESQSIFYVKIMGWYHIVEYAVAKMTTIFMEWQYGDILSYVASRPNLSKIVKYSDLQQ